MITLTQVKQELDLTGVKYNTLLTWLIDSVESVWDQMTNKRWASETYSELIDGSGYQTVFVSNYPITALINIATGKDQAIKIKNTTSGATASFSVSSTGLTLVLNDSSDATVTFATYTTLTAVNDAINVLGDGWVSSLYSGMGAYASSQLLPAMGVSCHDGYEDISIPSDYLTDFTVNENNGLIYSVFGFPRGTQNIRIKYTAGYTADTCPNWLQQTLIRQVGHWYLQSTEKRWHVSNINMSDGGTISYNKDGKIDEINLLSDFKNMAGMHRCINV